MSKSITGVVEAITKTSLIVTVDGQAQTLTGPSVEKTVASLKLGDTVTITTENEVCTITKGKKTAATAPSRQGNSPAAKPISTQQAW